MPLILSAVELFHHGGKSLKYNKFIFIFQSSLVYQLDVNQQGVVPQITGR